jgi:hypothetical protein
MKTVKTNIWDIKVGDKISFTNYSNCLIEEVVVRVEEKSWYSGISGRPQQWRNSWGTLAGYQKKFPDFKIERA